jgi:hypothetical protein
MVLVIKRAFSADLHCSRFCTASWSSKDSCGWTIYHKRPNNNDARSYALITHSLQPPTGSRR